MPWQWIVDPSIYCRNWSTQLTLSSTPYWQCGAIGVAYPPQVTEVGKCLSFPTFNPQGSPYLLNCRQELQVGEAGEKENGFLPLGIIVCHSKVTMVIGTIGWVSPTHIYKVIYVYWAYLNTYVCWVVYFRYMYKFEAHSLVFVDHVPLLYVIFCHYWTVLYTASEVPEIPTTVALRVTSPPAIEHGVTLLMAYEWLVNWMGGEYTQCYQQ